MLRRWKLDSRFSTQIFSAINAFFDDFDELSLDVKHGLEDKCYEICQIYEDIGLYVIGLWEWDEHNQGFDFDDNLKKLAYNKLLKYYPYLKVFNDEFIAITGEETHEREYENEHNRTENSTAEIGKTKESSTEFDGNGTDRKAEEESPIGSTSIDSAPTSSTVWNLASPSKKAGQQYDTHNESSGDESSTENRTNAIAGNETGEGTDNLTIRNPDKLLKILRFNVENLNLTKIAYMFVDSLVEEKNTIY